MKMNKKSPRIIIAWILAGLASLLVITSGIAKLTGAQEVVDGLTKIGIGPYIMALGIAELVFTALFLFPKTLKIGFLLITCYFSGALATDLSHGHSLVTPFVILVMVWVSTFLKNPGLFLQHKTA
jgi:hypothetical protein